MNAIINTPYGPAPVPTTGVHSGNDVEHWDDLTNGIDLAWHEHIKECEDYLENDYCDCEVQGRTLFGAWRKNQDGLYEEDPDGEYSAIYNPDENTIQVTLSKYRIQAHYCSPCYPGQVDVDTPGELEGYMLPPDMMFEIWLEENKDRFLFDYHKYQADRDTDCANTVNDARQIELEIDDKPVHIHPNGNYWFNSKQNKIGYGDLNGKKCEFSN